MSENISEKFECDDLVWARRKIGLPLWPARVMGSPAKDPPKRKKKLLYVSFLATTEQAWVLENNVHDYFENVREFSDFQYKDPRYIDSLSYAHELFWSLIPLKADSTSGYQLEAEQKIMIEEEEKSGIEEMKCSQFKEGSAKRLADEKKNSINPRDKKKSKKEDNAVSYQPIAPPETAKELFASLRLSPVVPKKCTNCSCAYGFLGIGNATSQLIYSLLANGHNVNIWSMNGFMQRDNFDVGAHWCHTPADVISNSQVVFYCSGDPCVSKQILFCQEGILDGCKRTLGENKLFVELTQVHEAEFDKCLKPLVDNYKGGVYVEVKTLVPIVNKERPIFYCACDSRVFDGIKFILGHLSKDVHYVGDEFGPTLPMEITPFITEELYFLELCNKSSIDPMPSVKSMRIDEKAYSNFVKDQRIKYKCEREIVRCRNEDVIRLAKHLKHIINP